MHEVLYLELAFLLCAMYSVYPPYVYVSFICHAAADSNDLLVTLQSVTSDEGNPATLSCAYEIPDTDTFYRLVWYKGVSISDPLTIVIGEFNQPSPEIPFLFNGYDDILRYRLSHNIDDSVSSLEISSARFSIDSGRYWCRTFSILGEGQASADLTIYGK